MAGAARAQLSPPQALLQACGDLSVRCVLGSLTRWLSIRLWEQRPQGGRDHVRDPPLPRQCHRGVDTLEHAQDGAVTGGRDRQVREPWPWPVRWYTVGPPPSRWRNDPGVDVSQTRAAR